MNNNHLHVNNVASGGTAKISADSGKFFHVMSAHNGDSSAATLTFADDSLLNTVTLAAGANLNLAGAPIICKSFTPSHASLAVFYHKSS